MFKTRSPIPFIVAMVIFIVLGIIMAVTGETSFGAHWEW